MPATPDQHDPDAPRCTHCRRLLFEHELDRWACRPCEDRAREQITAIPGLYGQLADALTPARAGGDSGGKVSVSRSAPLPVALTVLDLRGPGGMVAKLQAIEESWRTALGWTEGPRRSRVHVFASWRTDPDRDVPAHAKFIVNNLPWACERYEEVAFDLDVISGLYWQAKNTLAGTRPRVIYVVCRAMHDDGSECGQRLPVDINRASARCSACGARWGRDEWVALYKATQSQAA